MENLDQSYASNIYRENIIDHFKNPRNFDVIKDPDISYREVNPLCGDEVDIFVKLNNNKIEDFKFLAKGCAISIASASMLSEKVKNKQLTDVKNIGREDILNLLKIPISPVRIKCAMLCLIALKAGILMHENKGKK